MKNRIKKTGACLIISLFSTTLFAQTQVANYQIIPLPESIIYDAAFSELSKPFSLQHTTAICYPKGNKKMERNAAFLSTYIREVTGMLLPTVKGKRPPQSISLSLGLVDVNPEAYKLIITADGIEIQGASEAGVFYGVQTLRKSIPMMAATEVQFPAATITDKPRFSYRGMMLDVARHYFPMDFLKKYIDLLALHNVNKMHWHLSEDQGWRFEVKKYPRLVTVGSIREETVIGNNSGKYDGKPYGGFYTQDECREIVAYAAERYIDVIPEIDLPGHMQAALAAYPELGCTGGPYKVWTQWGISDDVLCAGNPKTLEFIKDVLSEIVAVFPSKYIHVGGDECPKVRWEKCPVCQSRAPELGIHGPHDGHSIEEQLQSYLIKEASAFLAKKGRATIGWDEILEGGLAPEAIVMSWRGIKGGVEAAKLGHDVIMTPNSHCYFDYYQTTDIANEPLAIGGHLPLERVYALDPIPSQLTKKESKHIVGVQANLWTEYIPTPAQAEYMTLPRLAALCETQWRTSNVKNYEEFLSRVHSMTLIYDKLGYNYAKHIYDIRADFTPNLTEGTLDVLLTTLDYGDIRYTLDGTTPTLESSLYTDALKIKKNSTIKAAVFRNNSMSRVFTEEIVFSKSSLKPITLLQPIHTGYMYKGASTLVDGLKGARGYRTGRWIAFNRNDLEAVIDLLEPTEIRTASISTCVVKGDWIFDARSFSVEVSDDGEEFIQVVSEEYPLMTRENRDGIYTHTLNFDPLTTRYVKVRVTPEHAMPEWHGSKGTPAFLFVDEISIN